MLHYWLKKHMTPGVMLALSVVITAGLNLPAILLFCYADRLGLSWSVLLFAYMGLLIATYALIIRPRELAKLRYDLGDERFFELFPREKKKEQRKLARVEHAREKKVAKQRPTCTGPELKRHFLFAAK